MNELFPVTGRPDWEDIVIDDIRECVLDGRSKHAVSLATLRIQGLQKSITEIEETLDRDINGRIIEIVWKGERAAIDNEIAELEGIIASVQKEQEEE